MLRYFRYTAVIVAVGLIYVCLSQRDEAYNYETKPVIVGKGNPLFPESLNDKPQDTKKHYGYEFGNFLSALHMERRSVCPKYVDYSKQRHEPYSKGKLHLPFQRPDVECRTYHSNAVEKVIDDFKQRLKNPDLARLFENCLPNTLDTTIMWHKNATSESDSKKADKEESIFRSNTFDWSKYPQSFIVTGDIHAEWLRDSAWQLSAYQKLAKYDLSLRRLITGAINTQARFIIYNPYCNAFQPPEESGVDRESSAIDNVYPPPNWKDVFECKWELDSLASFLSLTNHYYEVTRDDSIFNEIWRAAIETVLVVIRRELVPTFDKGGSLNSFRYTFQRDTNIGSETLPLTGSGNPVNSNTNLVRSAFRPSDDACIFQLFIPANAYLVAELSKLSQNIKDKEDLQEINKHVIDYATKVNQSIYDFGVVNHTEFGEVFAYEVDGYNSALFMDDANIPSLLSLPDLGFIDKTSQLYQNTRKMVLSRRSNPYYLAGRNFRGIGGPHVGYKYAWPMSLLVKIRTTDNDDEIASDLALIMENTAFLGLMHEGVNVNSPGGKDFTRPWFAWCNSEFGKTILDLAERKPHLIFKDEYKNKPYIVDDEFKGIDY